MNYIAGIAQLVEQWTENPRVTSSNLVPGNKKHIQKNIYICPSSNTKKLEFKLVKLQPYPPREP